MNNVNKTLYIPLFAKSFVSKKGLFIKDGYAEKIWDSEGFPLKGSSKSKWLSYYLGIRARVFDDWVRAKATALPDAAIIHIGCGLDSRVLRVGKLCKAFYDVDFPEVISERRRFFEERDGYRMIAGDACNPEWLGQIKESTAIVVMEGVSMYIPDKKLSELFSALSARFESVSLLMDCYSVFAAKMSKYKNPIKSVGVTKAYGIDEPDKLAVYGFSCLGEGEITPQKYIDELVGTERKIFSRLYAGRTAKKLYKLYEYKK